jgi:hypothetical protein
VALAAAAAGVFQPIEQVEPLTTLQPFDALKPVHALALFDQSFGARAVF